MIRSATRSDAPLLGEICGPPWGSAAVARLLDRPATGRAWIALGPDHAKAVGALLAQCVADEAEILWITVAPDHRRRGTGAGLVTRCLADWQREGVQQGWLEVRVDNIAARALYHRYGWVDAGIRHRYYADGTDAAQMRWEAPR